MKRTLAFTFFAFVLSASIAPVSLFGGAPVANAQASCDYLHPCTAPYVCNATGQMTGVCVIPQTNTNNATNQNQSQGTSGTQLYNPLGANSNLMTFVNSILNLITTTIGPIVIILMLVYTGFQFVVAQGNSSKIEEARRMLMWTIVGALILLGAEAISLAIQATVSGLSTG